jgi:hypothetical protein
LLLHQLQAAADRRLVHRKRRTCLGVGASKLEEIEDMQVF